MFATALIMTAFATVPTRADEVISSISLLVEADIRIGEPCRAMDIEVTPYNSGYEVRDIVLIGDGQVWGSADVPRFTVYLKPEFGNSFAVSRSSIRIKGAEYEFGRWEENMNMYLIQMRLPSLREQVGEISETGWESLTIARWPEAYNAAYYEVQLFCDGRNRRTFKNVTANSMDFGSYMRSEGAYSYRVRAINRINTNVKSEWKESGVQVVNSGNVGQILESYPNLSSPDGPGQQAVQQIPYGWIAEGARWWYRNPDGGYTTSDWQYIDEKWYYFNAQGYMVTGWINWNEKYYYCDPVSGAMLANCVVPDGLGRRVDSTGAWIQY